MQEHPWHHFWTRSIDAATGLGGSAESMSALTAKWWHQSVESGQIWARWWMNTWLSAGWPSHGGAGQAPAAWLPRRMDLPFGPASTDGPDAQERRPADADQAGVEIASASPAAAAVEPTSPHVQAGVAMPAPRRSGARVQAGQQPAGATLGGEGKAPVRRPQAKP